MQDSLPPPRPTRHALRSNPVPSRSVRFGSPPYSRGEDKNEGAGKNDPEHRHGGAEACTVHGDLLVDLIHEVSVGEVGAHQHCLLFLLREGVEKEEEKWVNLGVSNPWLSPKPGGGHSMKLIGHGKFRMCLRNPLPQDVAVAAS